MNLGFFGPQSPFDRSMSKLSSFFHSDQLFLEALKKAFIGRASLERDYLAALHVIVSSLLKQLDSVNNPMVKSSAYFICQDWMNMIEQSSKLAREYEFIASKEMGPHLSKQQEFVDKLKADMKQLKQQSSFKIEEYRRLQANFSKSHQELNVQVAQKIQGVEAKKTLEYLKRVKNRDQEKLFAQTGDVMKHRRESEARTKGVVNAIELNQAQLGDFYIDLGMKNFILQVNHLKNREYDMNQLIESFKQKNDNKFNYEEDPAKNSQKASGKQKFALPFTIEPPNNEFMKSLENQFYKNVHYELLNQNADSKTSGPNPRLYQNKLNQSYKNFEHEAIILSKLFDNKALSDPEKNIIRNLYLKEKPVRFLVDFFKSFMKYKMGSVYVKEASMLFFMLEIVEKIFIEFIRKRDYQPIFELIKIFQFIKIYKNASKMGRPSDQNPILNKSSRRSQSKGGFPDADFSTDFKFWVIDKNMSAQHVLSYTQFWIYSLDQIFSNSSGNGLYSDRSVSPHSPYRPNKVPYVKNTNPKFPSMNHGNARPKIAKKFSLHSNLFEEDDFGGLSHPTPRPTPSENQRTSKP